VGDADAASGVVRVLPVVQPSGGCAERAHEPHGDRGVGCLPECTAAREVHRIEDERGGPRAEGDIGQGRVQRVAEPGAVQGVLDAPLQLPSPGEPPPYEGSQCRAHAIEPPLTIDRTYVQ
jgi:hypothetical protein